MKRNVIFEIKLNLEYFHENLDRKKSNNQQLLSIFRLFEQFTTDAVSDGGVAL